MFANSAENACFRCFLCLVPFAPLYFVPLEGRSLCCIACMRRGGEMYNPCGIFQRVRVIVAGTVSLAVAWPSGNSKIYNSVSAIERRSGVCKLKVQGIPNP